LQAAVGAEHQKIVQLLLEANADPNASGGLCGTALQIAAFQGNELIVKLLLEAKANVNLKCVAKFGNVKHPYN
jgi:ankyrin repeat protein